MSSSVHHHRRITSHARLTGSQDHLDMLRDQMDSLSHELDASPWGLLDDYPDECYPIDVFAATYLIRRAMQLREPITAHS